MAIVLIACCGGGFYMFGQITDQVDKSQDEVAKRGDTYVNQILKEWDANEIVSLSTSSYKEEFSPDEFQVILDKNHKVLGEFIAGSGQASLLDPESGVYTYSNRATFKNGRAKVVLELVQENKVWKINRFSIEPD